MTRLFESAGFFPEELSDRDESRPCDADWWERATTPRPAQTGETPRSAAMFTIDDFLPDAAKGSNSTANNATSTKTAPPFLGHLGPDAASAKTAPLSGRAGHNPLFPGVPVVPPRSSPDGASFGTTPRARAEGRSAAEAESPVDESVPVSEAHPPTASDDDDESPRAASDPDPSDADPSDADPPDADPPAEGPGGGEAGDGTSEQEGPTPGDDSSRVGRVSWSLVARVGQVASALAVGVVPDAPGVCLAEAEDLLFARDRLISAIAVRVERVHAAGEARRAGHASTRSWLRGAAGMSVAGAGRVLALATELARLPTVRARFAQGSLAEGVVTAICSATARLTDEQAGLAEPILVGLADQATAAEIARAGRYLRAVLDPDGEADDGEADYRGRFLLVRESASGGVEGSSGCLGRRGRGCGRCWMRMRSRGWRGMSGRCGCGTRMC
ncbi:DUF222 domain-containing protein [Microtetraspora malaysiensis]|uniref:DUF222 domain-containing protein n=1 Tax=Microtetraspora malaysiensis TaxID=161358 RepID=UPI003D945817